MDEGIRGEGRSDRRVRPRRRSRPRFAPRASHWSRLRAAAGASAGAGASASAGDGASASASASDGGGASAGAGTCAGAGVSGAWESSASAIRPTPPPLACLGTLPLGTLPFIVLISYSSFEPSRLGSVGPALPSSPGLGLSPQAPPRIHQRLSSFGRIRACGWSVILLTHHTLINPVKPEWRLFHRVQDDHHVTAEVYKCDCVICSPINAKWCEIRT